MHLRNASFLLFVVLACLGCGDTPLAEFSSGPGKFKVLLPGKPKQSSTPGKNNVVVNHYSIETTNIAFLVGHYDSPDAMPNDADFAKKALTEEINGIVSAQPNGKVHSQSSIKLQDKYHGLEFTASSSKPKANTQIRGRTYIVGNRVYILWIQGTAEKAGSENATKFLDSFQITP